MKKWLIIGGLVFVIVTGTGAGLGYLGYVKMRNWNTSRKAKIAAQQAASEAGIAQRRNYLERHLSQKTRNTIPAEFYTYDGFRDWWRLPLVFPYQLMCIDTQDRASLAKYDDTQPVDDPNKSSTPVLWEIARIATDNAILVFETNDGTTTSYGLLQYESGKQSQFSDEEQMWAAAKKHGFSGAHLLVSVENLFSAYYDYEKVFVEQSPGDDSLKATPDSRPSARKNG